MNAQQHGLRLRLLSAIHRCDRAAISELDRTHGLDRIPPSVLSPHERKRALALRPNVNNKSCRPRRRSPN